MNVWRPSLSVIDGLANLILGILFLVVPVEIADTLGVPSAAIPFFASILGAAFLAISLGLFVEMVPSLEGYGLGPLAAVFLNVIGALVVMIWMLGGSLSPTAVGSALLWIVVVLMLAIGVLQFVIYRREQTK